MARLTHRPQTSLSDTPSLRLRAAWLYHNRGLTQAAIAEQLGISRSTVIRLLDEARSRAEVQVWINPAAGDCTDLALQLEAKFGLAEAIVVPGSGTPDETARDVGAALGQFLSAVILDGMTVGVAWGRTLNAALQTFRPGMRSGIQVVSLLGGVLEARSMNPIDFSWQLASRLNATCMLYLAPLVVDSPQTKQTLIQACGLSRLYEVAHRLDLAVITCGDLGPGGSSLSMEFLDDETQSGVLAAGAVCDSVCNFMDAMGRDIDHPVRDRMMTVGLDQIAGAGHVILASGGARRAVAIRATMLRTSCQTLVTDEAAAKALVAL